MSIGRKLTGAALGVLFAVAAVGTGAITTASGIADAAEIDNEKFAQVIESPKGLTLGYNLLETVAVVAAVGAIGGAWLARNQKRAPSPGV